MDDLYSVGPSSVPDRPPVPVKPPAIEPMRGPAGSGSAAAAPSTKAVAPVVMPPGSKLPGKLAPAAAAIAPSRPVKQEKVEASSDPNVATRQTVEKMCEYIRAGASDELVQWWAECGCTRYGRGARDPQSLAWSMYWLVKHAIVFARDEPRLFQVGEPDGLDMLIAPAVLVRMQQPKEDCDGFTMLLCALLACVGVKSVIVTIAADPADPSRWSHVFPMAEFPSGVHIPLDASHGTFPGWMVPRNHIFRWQAWSLDGQPIEVAMPRQSGAGLHGYTRRGARMRSRGMGQDCTFDDDGNETCAPTSVTPVPVITPITSGASPLPCTDVNGNPVVCGGLPPGSSTGYDPSTGLTTIAGGTTPSSVAQIINNALTLAAKDAQLALLPAGSYIGPNGAIVTGSPGVNPLSLIPSSITSFLPIVGIGLVVLLIVSSMEKK